MAPPKQPDANLSFLYLCLQNSDYTAIDFNAIADTLGITPAAARMRFYRLKKQLEGSNAGEADSEAADESAPPTPAKPSKRPSGKASGRKPAAKRQKTAKPKDEDEDEMAEAAEQE